MIERPPFIRPFTGIRPDTSPVPIKLPLFFKRWMAKLGFIKGYEAPDQVTAICVYRDRFMAAAGNTIFTMDGDGVMRPVRFDVEHENLNG